MSSFKGAAVLVVAIVVFFGMPSVHAASVEFKVFTLEGKKESNYATKGLLVHASGICVIGLPNDRTIQKIELEGNPVKLVSYDPYARYGFIKVDAAHVEGMKPSALQTSLRGNQVGVKGQSGNFLVVGEVGTHKGKVIPFSFHRLHKGNFSKPDTQFPFVIDEKGLVVGMLHSEVLGVKGAFYSVPASVLKKHLEDVIEFGVPTRAWVGVTLDANVGLPVVTSVRPTSAAAQAGFQKGDVIVSVSKKKITDYNAAVKAFYMLRAGKETVFEVVRGDAVLKLKFSPKKFPGGNFPG